MIYPITYSNGKLSINYTEFLFYDEFKVLADSFSEDVFYKILKFIFFRYDPRALPAKKSMNDDDAYKYAVENSGLPLNFNFKILQPACNRYLDELNVPDINILVNTRRSLKLANDTISKYLTLVESIDDSTTEDNKKLISQSFELLGDVKKAYDNIDAITKRLVSIEKIILSDSKETGTIRGGGSIKPSMNGDDYLDE